MVSRRSLVIRTQSHRIISGGQSASSADRGRAWWARATHLDGEAGSRYSSHTLEGQRPRFRITIESYR